MKVKININNFKICQNDDSQDPAEVYQEPDNSDDSASGDDPQPAQDDIQQND